MPDRETMIIRPNKAVAGGFVAGKVAEIDYDYGQLLVDRGHAIDVTEIVNRLELTTTDRYAHLDVEVLRSKLASRDLPTSGRKAELVARLARDDEVPGKVDTLLDEELAISDPDPVSTEKAVFSSGTTTTSKPAAAE